MPSRVWTVLALQTQAEFLRLLRLPSFVVGTLAFPLMLFTFFALPHAHDLVGHLSAQEYLLASFAAFSVVSVGLFQFGVGVSADRDRKVTQLMRVVPMPPPIYLLSKVIASFAISSAVVVLLCVYAAITAGMRLPVGSVLLLTACVVAGSLPFIALGFTIGYTVPSQAALAVANLIYFPMTFVSGLLVPIGSLPAGLQQVAHFSPAYYLGQLAWASLGAGTEPLAKSVAVLACYSVALFALAVFAYQRDSSRQFA